MRKQQPARNADIFEDLGFSPIEAASLQLRSALMNRLIREIETRELTQARAAKLMSISQPRVSDLMRGKLHLFSLDMLVGLLGSLGLKVDLRVRKAA
jgi:predicted XRE-type DNA-binding protein